MLLRLLQGLFGAALIPLSQAVLLDINPPEKHGSAMAIWGAGAVLGPILGPALGRLADRQSRLALGVLHQPARSASWPSRGSFLFLSEKKGAEKRPFDVLGFASLALAIGGFQMMLDRGPSQDWFGSARSGSI